MGILTRNEAIMLTKLNDYWHDVFQLKIHNLKLKYKRDYFNFYIFAWANKMSNICTPL